MTPDNSDVDNSDVEVPPQPASSTLTEIHATVQEPEQTIEEHLQYLQQPPVDEDINEDRLHVTDHSTPYPDLDADMVTPLLCTPENSSTEYDSDHIYDSDQDSSEDSDSESDPSSEDEVDDEYVVQVPCNSKGVLTTNDPPMSSSESVDENDMSPLCTSENSSAESVSDQDSDSDTSSDEENEDVDVPIQ